MSTVDQRWVGGVDATLEAHRRDLDRHGERLDGHDDDIVALRLDVRGLVVRVALYAALAASLAAAVFTPLIYLVLTHFAGTPPQGALP